MQKKTILTILSLCLLVQASFSQINRGGTPISFSQQQISAADVPTEVTPPIDLASLEAEDAISDNENVPWRFANPFPVDFNLKNAGKWDELPNGDRIWRLNISCPDALSINLTYSDFYIPPGGLVYLYNSDHSQILGAFSDHNNSKNGRFGTALLYDDMITIEYFEPSTVKHQGRIAIDIVAHGYRYLGESGGNVGPGNSGNCQVDVNCPEGDNWQDEKKGVARIVVNGSSSCTGSLINNEREDCTPYFLTADHCIGSLDANGNTDASAWCFYWNFERPDCNNGTAPSTPYEVTAGATLVANDSPSDFALFLLTENPNDVYDVYYNGWNATNITGIGGAGIHHPSGDAKKIATHVIQPFDDDWFGSSPAGSHWEVSWIATANGHSVTEGGSSGSPLFDANSRVIGQLHGGSSINCSNPANDPGIYGKVSYSWTNNNNAQSYRRLRDWLDPDNTGTTTLDGAYLCNDPTVYFDQASSTVSEASANVTSGCLDYLEFDVSIKISRAPSQDATLSLSALGSATAGDSLDYTLSTNTITLNASNLEDIVTIRVYNDAYVEGLEDILLSFTLDANGGNAVVNLNRDDHTIDIIDDDQPPSTATISVDLFTERFNAGLGSWTVTDGGSTTDTWENSTGYNGNSANSLDGSSFVFVDSDAPGNGSTMSETLTSPAFNGLNMNKITLEFDEYVRVYTGGTVETFDVQVFDGNTWTSVLLRDQNDGSTGGWSNPNRQSIDISPYAAANMQIRFVYDAAWDYWWAIDNINVIGKTSVGVQTSVNVGASDTQYLGPNSTVHFYDPNSGNVMLSLENLSAHDYGCTDVYVENAGKLSFTIPAGNVEDVTSKTFRIVPTNNNPSGSYKVSLYYTAEEIDGWVSSNTSSGTIADLLLIKTPANVSGASVAEVSIPTVGSFGNNSIYEATFNTGFSGFALGNSSAPLPIELLSFDGKHLDRQGNLLQWSTASEINSDRFELERSFDASNFETIASIAAKGDTEKVQDYSFLDEKFKTGKHYYRLRMIDTDGSFEHSELIQIEVTRANEVTVYPNPVQGILNINIKRDNPSDALIRIYDARGNLVRERQIKSVKNQLIPINMEELAKGIYLIHIEQDQETFQYKIVKD